MFIKVTVATEIRFLREIQGQRNKLLNDIDTRKFHPSYGITKSSLWETYHILMGMCFSYLYLSEKWKGLAPISLHEGMNELLMEDLSVDLLGTKKKIQES